MAPTKVTFDLICVSNSHIFDVGFGSIVLGDVASIFL